MRLLILADDMTGACDTAAQFGSRGLSVHISVSAHGVGRLTDGVHAINTATRHTKATELYQGRNDLSSRLGPISDWMIYQKIDSSLRGMVVEEIESTMDAFNRLGAVIAPAFPAVGRTTVGGFQLLDNDLVSRTSAGRDILAPVKEASIEMLIRRQIPEAKIGHINVGVIHQGVAAVKQTLNALRDRDVRYIVCDALIQRDLDVVAKAIWEVDPHLLWVGSAGLARALSDAANLGESPVLECAHAVTRPLIVAGSLHPVTRAQVKRFLSSVGHSKIILKGEEPIDDGPLKDKITAAWSDGVFPVLTTDSGRIGNAERLKHRLADVVGSLEETPTHLVLTGGDVAEAVLSRLKLNRLGVKGEILDGIPVMYARDRQDETVIVTKSGAFGEEDTLLKVYQWMADTSGLEACSQ